MDQRGSTTVFFASVFLSMLLLVSICLEGIYLYVGKGKAMGAYMSGLMSTQGNYQKELHENYHLFGLDPRYTDKLTKDVKENMSVSLCDSKDNFFYEIGEIGLSHGKTFDDNEAGLLKYQIREFMKYSLGKDGVEKLTKQLANPAKSEEIQAAKQQLTDSENAAKNQEDKKEDDTKDQVTEKVKDPRKGFMSMINKGIISLVYPKGKKISKKTIKITYGKEEKIKQSKINFFKSDSVASNLDENTTKDYGNSLSNELLGVAYGTKVFHHGASKEKKDGTQYEVEYLICGNSSEEANLGGVLSRTLAIRFLTNRVCLLRDQARTAEAETLAAAILGVTGIPPLVTVGKELLLAALAYGESILDLRNLVEGKKIPVIKDSTNWQLEFAGLATLTGKRKPVQNGLNYENMLQMLMLVSTKPSMKYLRMMDLMEGNIEEKVPGFTFQKCYASYQVAANVKMGTFGFAGMRIPLLSSYPLKYKRTVVY
ncbi:MAG: DUF5702 domain-containing protein [Anaerostipes sp.]|jgi:hypothetical protein